MEMTPPKESVKESLQTGMSSGVEITSFMGERELILSV
jgi:hypothetical protein